MFQSDTVTDVKWSVNPIHNTDVQPRRIEQVNCPHCLTSFHESWSEHQLVHDPIVSVYWHVKWLICPECRQAVIALDRRSPKHTPTILSSFIAYPKSTARPVSSD